MAKNIQLLLTENVSHLGIVGDVVRVRLGYARNYLIPRGLATEPSDEIREALAAKREEAERQLRELRAQREKMVEKLESFEVTLQRSCNDQGLLYGSITQKDIADALVAEGFNVEPRDVRLGQTIKRVDSYSVLVKLDQDLEADVKLWVVPDRELNVEERDEMEFDEEGNLIRHARPAKQEAVEAGAEEGAASEQG